MRPPVDPSAVRRFRAIQVLFALSGATALAYEVVWGRLLVTALGGSALATSAVLTAYMGGLALGSFVFGGLSRATKTPLRAYAFVELGIGIAAFAFGAIGDSIVGLPPVPRMIAATATLLVPTFLMGGTIPFVMAWADGVGLAPGKTLARLYGVNTLGAAIGCVVTGFLAIPKIGLAPTNVFAVMMNIAIGGVASLLSQGARTPRRTENAGRPIQASEESPDSPSALHALAFLSGMTALGFEVLWIRLLRITLGSTTYVFTIVVATYVLGIGLGGILAGRFREGEGTARTLVLLQSLVVVVLGLDFALLPKTPAMFGALRAALPGWDGALAGSLLLAFLALFPATLLSGLTFPLLGRLYLRRGHKGREAGVLYAVNTLGAVGGSLLTTLVFVPAWGSASTYGFLWGLALVSVFLYRRIAGPVLPRGFTAVAGALVLSWAALVGTRPGWTPAYLAHAAYLPGRAETVEPLVFEEGRSSTVLVERFGADLGMAVDGKPEASTAYVDRANQVLLGHLPAMLVPRVDRALVIGLGSGMTLGMLPPHHPSTLEVVELEARMRDAAIRFGEFNHHVMERSDVRFVVDDGLNYLSATNERYDVVTSDPIQPFFRGAAGLYTTEFFERARARLAPGGVMAHWLPLANMSTDDFKMIVRTFIGVFPHARLYWTGGFADTILVGTNGDFGVPAIDRAAFDAAKDDLAGIYIASPEEMEALLIADEGVLAAWAGDGPLNAMDRPRLEFSAPRSVYANTIDRNMLELLALRRAMNGDDEVWRVVSVLLAYRAGMEHADDRDAVDRVFLDALGCTPPSATCPAAKRSGVVRRVLFERALAAGDRDDDRAVLEEEARGSWWSLSSSAPTSAGTVRNAYLDRALDAYANARALAAPGLPDELALVRARAEPLAATLPEGSPQAARAAALAKP